MQVIIFGAPGVGKGTQSNLISKKLGLVHLSTGEILRDAVAAKTELGLKAREIMNKGELVSDDIMIGIIHDVLSKKEMKNKGFILDGFPRTVNQAVALDKIFKEFGYNDVKVLNLTADNKSDEAEIIKRLMNRGRADDNIETVTQRLQVYKDQTAPVKEYYLKEYPVLNINGVGKINEINKLIIKALTDGEN